MPKLFGFLTDWRNGIAVLITVGVVVWLMQDGGLPAGSIIIIFLLCLTVVYVMSGIWSLLTRRRKTP